jgi:Mlc titration factor MtfA (ptsG expression regulator)
MTYLIFIPIILFVFYMLLRKKSSSKTPVISDANKALLNEHVEYYQKQDAATKARFETLVEDFLQYVRIEGVGTEITKLDKILIASSAVIPIMGFPNWKYRNLTNVIVYPDTFDHKFQYEGDDDRNILGYYHAPRCTKGSPDHPEKRTLPSMNSCIY